jgi:hypothetical protein
MVRSLDKAPCVRTRISTQIDPGDRLSFAVADFTTDAGRPRGIRSNALAQAIAGH